MSSAAEEINLSEHPQIAEPAKNVTEVTEQSMRALSETLFKKMNSMLKVMKNAEYRHMTNNSLPHETIRQIISILHSFDCAKDPSWLMRALREQVLIYVRSLSNRYPRMEDDEKVRLARALTFEAFRRHLQTPLDEAGKRKFALMVTIGELTENDDTNFFFHGCSMFLPRGSITVEKLMRGYDECVGYHELRSRASHMAQFEMQSFLRLTSMSTDLQITQIVNPYKTPEPSLVEAERVAAAILASEAEAPAAAEAQAAEVAAAEAVAAEAAVVPEAIAIEP